MEREADWYDQNSDLAMRPLVVSPWLGLYVLLAHWILSVADRDDAQGVLDLGAGPGLLGELLREHNYPYPYVAADFSELALATAAHRKLGIVRLDLRDGPRRRRVMEACPGVIVFSEVLEHIIDDVAIIRDVPVGRFVIVTGPNFASEAHVRHYRNLAELREAYAPLLQIHLTGVVDLSPPQGRRIFAVAGWRTEL